MIEWFYVGKVGRGHIVRANEIFHQIPEQVWRDPEACARVFNQMYWEAREVSCEDSTWPVSWPL